MSKVFQYFKLTHISNISDSVHKAEVMKVLIVGALWKTKFSQKMRVLQCGCCLVISSNASSSTTEDFSELDLSSRLVTPLKPLNKFCATHSLTVPEQSTIFNFICHCLWAHSFFHIKKVLITNFPTLVLNGVKQKKKMKKKLCLYAIHEKKKRVNNSATIRQVIFFFFNDTFVCYLESFHPCRTAVRLFKLLWPWKGSQREQNTTVIV